MMEVSKKIVCLLTYMVVNVIVAKRCKSLTFETMWSSSRNIYFLHLLWLS